MADPTDKPYPTDFAEGGGPVKTFLGHLDDLRWLLIKNSIALVVDALLTTPEVFTQAVLAIVLPVLY
jgi:hypothetical protein